MPPPIGLLRDNAAMAVPVLVLVVALYASVATAYVEARRRRERAPTWARWTGVFTVAAHLAGLMALSMSIGSSPYSTSSQSLSFLAFALAGLYLILEATSHVASHGGWFYGLAAFMAAISVPGLIEAGPPAVGAGQPDVERSWHVGLALLSTAAVVVSGLLAAGYLGTYMRVKRRTLRNSGSETHAPGPSLSGFQRLTRNASFLGMLLLAPSFVFGVNAAMRDGAPPYLLILTASTAAVLVLLTIAWLIWWRRPLRGALAAWLNVSGTLLVFISAGIVHPLVLAG